MKKNASTSVKKPIIELKNLKYAVFASHETNCYRATIYVDGKKMLEGENNGQGGGDVYYWAKSADHPDMNVWRYVQQLDERIAATYPALDGFGGDMISACLETVIIDLINRALLIKETRRRNKSHVAYALKAQHGTGNYYVVKRPSDPKRYAALIERLRAHDGIAIADDDIEVFCDFIGRSEAVAA